MALDWLKNLPADLRDEYHSLTPGRRWAIALVVALGILSGLLAS